MRSTIIAILFSLAAPAAFAQVNEAKDSAEYESIPDQSPAGALVEEFGAAMSIGDAAGARPLLPVGLDLIKDYEGWEPKPYNDAVGYCTIGYGHLIDLKKCEVTDKMGSYADGITEAEGLALLDKDTVGSRLAVQRLVTAELTEGQFSALSSFVFNLGASKFARSTLLKLINMKTMDPAAGEFSRWTKAGGVILAGLVSRRDCEAMLFKGMLAVPAGTVFKRSLCTSNAIGGGSAGDPIDVNVGE